MEPAIFEIAGFVVFNWQHTEFIKMPKKFVALSVALYRWSCYLICHKKLKHLSEAYRLSKERKAYRPLIVYFSKSSHPVSFQTVQPDEGFFLLRPFRLTDHPAG